MLTRSFLFLLAILTGVAAPAASAAQPQQAAVGSSAEMVSSKLIALASADENNGYSYADIHGKLRIAALQTPVTYTKAYQFLVTPRTYRGDRTRE